MTGLNYFLQQPLTAGPAKTKADVEKRPLIPTRLVALTYENKCIIKKHLFSVICYHRIISIIFPRILNLKQLIQQDLPILIWVKVFKEREI